MDDMQTQIRTVERAIALIGRTELADELGVWWSDIQRWRSGEEPMPRYLLERATMLILAKYRALPWTGAEAGETAGRPL